MTADANFLILDEPTNHLDIQSVNILIQALRQYEGTFVLVSHDRYLLDNVANKIWFIEDQQIKEYPGTYAEYEEWQAKRNNLNQKTDQKAKSGQKGKGDQKPKTESKPRVDQKQPDNSRNNNRKLNSLNKELEEAEKQITALEMCIKELEAEMADEKVYSNQALLTEKTTPTSPPKSSYRPCKVSGKH